MTVKIPTITYRDDTAQRLMPPEMDQHVTATTAIVWEKVSPEARERRKDFLRRNLAITVGHELVKAGHVVETEAELSANPWQRENATGYMMKAYTIPASYSGDFLQYAVDRLYWQSYHMKDEAGGAQVRRLVDMIIQELSQDEEIKDATERPVVTPA